MRVKAGFTIVELLIVIVVIGILASITVVSYSGIQDRARDAKRISDVATISKAMQMWSIQTGNTYEELSTGYAGGGATGYYTTSYSGNPSIRDVLSSSGYISANVQGEPGARYMLARCTNAADNRRVVMAALSQTPDETVAQQLAGSGCNNAYINTFASGYGMNYAIVVEG